VGNDHHQPTNQPTITAYFTKMLFFLSFIYLFLHTPAEITAAAAAAAMTTTPFKISPMTT
jgi:hypothetical protein